MIQFWGLHGTKILGTLATIVATLLTIPNLIPPDHMVYWTAASAVLGVLTVNRGVTNTATQEKLYAPK